MKLSRYIALAILILAGTSAFANSLWVSGSNNLCADQKASKVGDVVTILIVETTTSNQKASTTYDKKLEHSNDQGIGLLLKNLPSLDVATGQKGSASGATTRTSNFIAKITATVTKVLPNGNLELEGARSISTNSERQEIKLTGTVRQQDIAPDNTVLSTYLADAKVTSSGKGPIGDRQKEGLISKIIKFLF